MIDTEGPERREEEREESSSAWLKVRSVPRRHTTVIRVSGHLNADRAEQLWDAIEYALESEPGRRVVVDLTRVGDFDRDAMRELGDSARTAARRHDDLRLLIDPRNGFGRYLVKAGAEVGWPVITTPPD